MTTEPKVIQVSYSEIKDARRCSFKHDLAWRHGWRKIHRDLCECALCVGIAWHEVLNAYYDGLSGRYDWSPASEIDAYGKRKGGWHAARDTIKRRVPDHLKKKITWMLEGYAAQYGKEPGWTVRATEKQLIVPLPQLYEDLIVMLKVKIDLIIEDPNGKLWVDDHKTCAQLPTEKRQVDPQLPLYMWAIKKAKEETPKQWTGKPAFGARYSYARKPSKTFVDWPLEKRFRRRLVAHTDKEIYNIARDCYISIYTRYNEAALFDRPPRVIGEDCSYLCDFEQACLGSRKGYDINRFLESGFYTYRPNDPKNPE